MLYKFIGENGSLGLTTNQYYLVIKLKEEGKIVAYITNDYNKIIACPYDNERNFRKNWEKFRSNENKNIKSNEELRQEIRKQQSEIDFLRGKLSVYEDMYRRDRYDKIN